MKETIYLDIIYIKISYILACLNSYTSLDLSKRIKNINDNIHLIKKSIIDNKAYVEKSDWLDKVVTLHARRKIIEFIKDHEK